MPPTDASHLPTDSRAVARGAATTDVTVYDARRDHEDLLLVVGVTPAWQAGVDGWALRFDDITGHTNTTVELADEWVTAGPDQPGYRPDQPGYESEEPQPGAGPAIAAGHMTIRMPAGELLPRIGSDGTYRVELIAHRAPALSLAASVNQPPGTVGLTFDTTPVDLPELVDQPPHTQDGHRLLWFRRDLGKSPQGEGRRSGLGLKVVAGDMRADIARIDVDPDTIRFGLTIAPPSHGDRPLVARLTNRLSGEYDELPVALGSAGPTIELPLGELAESALAQDGTFDIRLRRADGTWLHQVGTADTHRTRHQSWTFPAATIPTAPTQRLRPYFTTEDTIAVLSTPLLSLKDVTLTAMSGRAEAAEATLEFTAASTAVPDWERPPNAIRLRWRASEPPPTVTAQQCAAAGANKFRYRLTLQAPGAGDSVGLDRLATAIDAGDAALIEFDGGDAGPTSAPLRRDRKSKPAPPASLVGRLAHRVTRRAKKSARLAFYRLAATAVPVRPCTAVFQSFLGSAYADSPAAIAEVLAERGKRWKIYWVAKKSTTLHTPTGMRQVQVGSLAYYWQLATARYFVSNTNLPDFVTKRRGQRHLQTWHGTPLKRIGMDVSPTAPGYALQDNPALHRRIARWDALVAPSRFCTDVFASAFAHRARVIERGYPRNDLLVDTARGTDRATAAAHDIRRRLGIAADATVVLYMPTWRDGTPKAHRSFLPIPIRRLAKALGGDTTVLLRLHYTMSTALTLPFDLPQVRDVSGYPDSADLLAIADVLITDYSSVFYDYSILDRPIVFHTHDLDNYEFRSRGFYWDFRHFNPWPIVRTGDELIRHTLLAVNDPDRFPVDRDLAAQFRAAFTSLETGHAGEDVARRFFGGDRHG